MSSQVTAANMKLQTNLQNSVLPVIKLIDAAVYEEAQKGLSSKAYTLTGADIALGPRIAADYTIRGFSAVLSGVSSEILTISWES